MGGGEREEIEEKESILILILMQHSALPISRS